MRFKAALACLLLVVGTAAVADEAQFQFIGKDGTVLTNVIVSVVDGNGLQIGRYGFEADGVYSIPANPGEKVYFSVHQPITGADFDAEGYADNTLNVVQIGQDIAPAQVANDLCADAVPIAVPSLTAGSTVGAATDIGYTTPCGLASITSPGVWYTFVGTGTELIASMCENSSAGSADFDTKLSIYCLTCDEPSVCVDGNDDELGCNFHSTVGPFGTEAGAVYYALVHGFGGETGTFNLDLIDTGVPFEAPFPPVCTPPPPTGACCDCLAPPFNCADGLTADLCAERGGQYLGDDSVCFTPPPTIQYESLPGLPIDANNTVVSDTITVADSFLITDVNVEMNITHTWIGDLDITVEHNGTAVVVFFHQCSSTDNINSTADDEGTELYCSSIALGPSDAVFWPPDVAGLGPLSVFDGMDVLGDWTLTVVDTYPSLDDGSFDRWVLVLPQGAPTPNCPDQNNETCFLCPVGGGGGTGDDDDDDSDIQDHEFASDSSSAGSSFGRN